MSTSRPKPPLPTWKKVLASALVFAVFFAVLEVGARLLVEPPTATSLHRDHTRLIDVMGLPSLNRVMQPDPHLFWRLKKELRDVRVEGKLRGASVAFTVNVRDGLRTPPLSKPKRGVRILALGDSTTFGLGADDEDTWPAQLERMLRARGDEAEVVNLGVPGYSAFQGQRLLQSRGMEMDPDLVIATFGFNDKETWANRSEHRSALFAAYGGVERYLLGSRLYYGLRMAWSARTSRGAASPGPATHGQAGRETKRPRLDPGEFVEQLAGIKALCDESRVPLAVVLWPLAGQVHASDRKHAFYQQHSARFCRDHGVPCIDVLDRFVDEKALGRWYYVDHIHVGKEGNAVVAEEVLQTLGQVFSAPGDPQQ